MNLFERRVTFNVCAVGPKPLPPLFNGLEEGKAICGAAAARCCASSEGDQAPTKACSSSSARTYRSFAQSAEPPVTTEQVLEVNRLVEALKPEGSDCMRALVTGANGFLGVHVASALIARGHQVRAAIRPAAKSDELTARGVTDIVRADCAIGPRARPSLRGVDVLVHLAAAVTGGEDAQFASTVVGTERLLGAMAQTACRRIVLASSFSVYDWSDIRGTLDEGSPIEPPPDLYGRDNYSIAKSWQELVTRRFAEKQGWDLIGPTTRIHLGPRPRLSRRLRSADWPDSPRHRAHNPNPHDPRRELRRLFRRSPWQRAAEPWGKPSTSSTARANGSGAFLAII